MLFGVWFLAGSFNLNSPSRLINLNTYKLQSINQSFNDSNWFFCVLNSNLYFKMQRILGFIKSSCSFIIHSMRLIEYRFDESKQIILWRLKNFQAEFSSLFLRLKSQWFNRESFGFPANASQLGQKKQIQKTKGVEMCWNQSKEKNQVKFSSFSSKSSREHSVLKQPLRETISTNKNKQSNKIETTEQWRSLNRAYWTKQIDKQSDLA